MDDVRHITRFPRLATAQNASAYARLLCADPIVSIRFDKKSSATQFIFTIPVPPEFRKSYDVPYQMIFEYFDWEKATREAYGSSTYGGKPLAAYISLGLHKALMDALKKWLVGVRGLARDNECITKQELDEQILGNFSQDSQKRKGPQPNPDLTLWVTNRFSFLLPKISALRRSFMKRDDPARHQDFTVVLEKLATRETIRYALLEIFQDPKGTKAGLLLVAKLSNQEIISAIVRSELKQKGCNLQKISFRTYLRLGRKLSKLLAHGPDQKSSKTALR